MSNFTRSILYSTSVLIAGLVAIFAVYNNVANLPKSSDLARLSPAAGDSDLGINYSGEPLGIHGSTGDNVSSDVRKIIGPVHEIDDSTQKALDEIDATIDGTKTDEESIDVEKDSFYDDGRYERFKIAGDNTFITELDTEDFTKTTNLSKSNNTTFDVNVSTPCGIDLTETIDLTEEFMKLDRNTILDGISAAGTQAADGLEEEVDDGQAGTTDSDMDSAYAGYERNTLRTIDRTNDSLLGNEWSPGRIDSEIERAVNSAVDDAAASSSTSSIDIDTSGFNYDTTTTTVRKYPGVEISCCL